MAVMEWWCAGISRNGVTGVVVTLSMALLGMAVGRLLSWLVDRRLDRYPALFMAIEIVLGLGLLISL